MSKHRVPTEMRPIQQQTIDELCAKLNITEWDAIILADGSGSRWDYPMGWAAVLIDKFYGKRKLIHGSSNVGTNQIAELLPFVMAVDWYAQRDGPGAHHIKTLRENNDPRDLLIHCVSDAQVTVKQGNGEYQLGGAARDHWWHHLHRLGSLGYRYKFHWLGREIAGLNRLCDYESKQCRKGVQELHGLLEATLALHAELLTDIKLKQPNIYEDGWIKASTVKAVTTTS